MVTHTPHQRKVLVRVEPGGGGVDLGGGETAYENSLLFLLNFSINLNTESMNNLFKSSQVWNT